MILSRENTFQDIDVTSVVQGPARPGKGPRSAPIIKSEFSNGNDFERIDFSGRCTAIVSLGCSRNTVDSEVFLQAARSRGAILSSVEQADLILVNTCAFTREAKEESLQCIQELRQKKGKKRPEVVVLGCLARRYEKELRREMKDVIVVGMTADFKSGNDLKKNVSRLSPRHSAYLKIAEGCDNRCTFCAIPLIKGRLRSRPEKDILEEAEFLSRQGVKELNIIGQDITLYGFDADAVSRQLPLTGLLKKILKKTTIPWVRLLYLHPRRVSADLIDLMKGEKRICPYLDIPLQHVNERLLKMMGRLMKKKDILKLMESLKKNLPEAALRTTFIVGFPTETRREFEELLAFVRQVPFDKLGAFAYSREEGTPAYRLKNQVSRKERMRRFDELLQLQREISGTLLKKKVGQFLDVLVDETPQDDTIVVARTAQDAPEVDGVLYLESSKRLRPGDFVRCRVTDSYEYDLAGKSL